jgi:cholest-4-en-3-one 26-monooxygenase
MTDTMQSTGALHDPETYAFGFPYERFARLRAEDPVSRQDHPLWPRGYWALTRYADVRRVSRDSTTFRNSPNPFLSTEEGGDDNVSNGLLISLDAPEHLKLRKLINRGFTPRRVADLEAALERRVHSLIDALAGRDGADLVDDLAMWLPLHVIADLVGVPEEDRRQVFDWTELTFGFDPSVDLQQRQDAGMAMFAYADNLCAKRREEPADDLISVLLGADVDGEQLTQLQIDLFFMLLQNAGSETTRNLITTGTLALLQHPDQLARLRSDLALLPTAIEELLRWVTPVMQFVRTAATDTEIGGQAIAEGDKVVMFYTSANRDGEAFAEPDRLDVTRSPNDHVAFGAGGPHFCLGASLARLEARVMFEAILSRFEGLEVTVDPTTQPRVYSNLIDGFAHLPVRWSAIG